MAIMPALQILAAVMKKLLEELQDGHFHSGAELGALLGVTRSAVWKQLQVLESESGLVVHKVRGRGYRLAQPLSLLDEQALADSCAQQGWTLRLLDRVDSTNAEAQRLASAKAILPVLVLAEQQTSGRGRRGRGWVSPFAENLYYSLALRVDGSAQYLEGASLAVGLAVVRALQECGLATVGLKWPNDVLAAGKKIAGILLELTGDPADICHVVIGIGINVNMTASRNEIDQPWTSLALELGGLCDRTALTAALNRHLAAYLERQLAAGFGSLRGEWEAHHLWQNQDVVLSAGANRLHGVAVGVDERGALRLQTSSGEQHYSGGELSLRLRDDS